MEQEEEGQPRETKHKQVDEQVAQQPSETTSGPSDAMAKLEPLDTNQEMERKRPRLGEAVQEEKDDVIDTYREEPDEPDWTAMEP